MVECEDMDIKVCEHVSTNTCDNMIVGAFSGRIGLPPAVTGWAASRDDGP